MYTSFVSHLKCGIKIVDHGRLICPMITVESNMPIRWESDTVVGRQRIVIPLHIYWGGKVSQLMK